MLELVASTLTADVVHHRLKLRVKDPNLAINPYYKVMILIFSISHYNDSSASFLLRVTHLHFSANQFDAISQPWSICSEFGKRTNMGYPKEASRYVPCFQGFEPYSTKGIFRIFRETDNYEIS